MAEGFNAFTAAQNAVDTVEQLVGARIADATATAEKARDTAYDVIADLKHAGFTVPEQPPAPPLLEADVTFDADLPVINSTSFGTINPPSTTAVPAMDAVAIIQSIDIPEFTASIASLTIPTPPSANFPTAPTQATLPADPTIPTAPTLSMPIMDQMAAISIPAFTFPVLPTFDATAPEFAGTPIDTVLQWAEPTYSQEILDEVLVVIRRMFAGGSGLPPAIEQAIFERSLDREDALIAKAVNEAYTDFSDRGFTMPSGALAARVDAIRADGLLKKQGASRDLSIKIAEIEVENMKFAVQQGIAAENVLVNIFLNMAQRMFEAAKFQLQSQIEIYNAQVTLFNARQQAYQTAANVYKAKLDAALSQLEVYKTQIEGERAKADMNKVLVDTYDAKVRAMLSQVEIYKAQMEGARIQSQVIETKISAYRADVEAYAARVNAEKTRFNAYKSQVDAEVAKAGIIDAEARAYAALISGKQAVVQLAKTQADTVIASNENKIRAFMAQMEVDKTRMQYELNRIQASAQAYTADTQRFIAQAGAEESWAKVELANVEQRNRTLLAYYEAQVRAYTARMEQLIREAQLSVEGLKAAGQLSATIAAGAMAGVNVGANLSGAGGLNATGSVSDAYTNSKSESTSHNYSYEGNQ